jgi:hypothetical protein
MTNPLDSGDGTRPTTAGGAANIGPAKKLTDNGNVAPAKTERMTRKRQDAKSAETDDSDAFHLHENLKPDSNQEP